MSSAAIQGIEAGRSASLESYVRIADALGLSVELLIGKSPVGHTTRTREADLVHSGMGEVEAAHLRSIPFPVALDEPYQHFQFAGRADVIAWDLAARALLHLENRTRFPNFQEAVGSFNAKRAYLSKSVASRLAISGWSAETHVMVCLWSAEVLHAIRQRPESFRAICPDPLAIFDAWWRGEAPRIGKSSVLVLLDPLAAGRQRVFVGIDDAMSVKPRPSGYADVADKLLGRRSTGDRIARRIAT